MFLKIYIYHLFLNNHLESNTPTPAFLLILEFDPEDDFDESVEDVMGFALDHNNSVKTASSELYFQLGEELEFHVFNVVYRAGAEAILC